LSLTEKLLATILARLMGYKVYWIEHLRIERWLQLNPYLLSYIFNSYFVTTIAVSQAVKDQLVELGLSKKRVEVIYNGIDINKFQPNKFSKLQPNKLIIGTVCRLSPEKGVDFLIKSFAKARKDNKDLILMIVGEGSEKEDLVKLTKKLNIEEQVYFLGWQDDIPKFLNSIDVFALTPTRRESFGISAAEASACELPVIATNISGLKEVVKDGETGIVVKSENIESICQSILKLSNNSDLRNRMGQAGRKRVIQNFTIEKMIDGFEDTFLKK
jgi:glycosyltransferase involved in cell wall biosynthesis